MSNQPHFNGLTPAEAERLALLLEECGEVVQIVGKILRHGYLSHHPDDPYRTPNRRLLEKEVGDVRAAISLMLEAGDMQPARVQRNEFEKRENVRRYLHHQD